MPASVLLSVNTVPRKFQNLHKGITVHGLLASFLAFGGCKLEPYAPWFRTWPSQQDVERSMPLLWPPGPGRAKSSLDMDTSLVPTVYPFPPAIGGRLSSPSMACYTQSIPDQYSDGLLRKQEMRLQKDWSIVTEVFPHETLRNFTYFWLLVNSRSFYYKLPEARKLNSREDHMVLCPFIDYFNHSDKGVS